MIEKVKEIPLTRGQVSLVDEDLYEELNSFKWNAYWSRSSKSFYATRPSTLSDGRKTTVWMHRQILGLSCGDPRQGDHKDTGDTLNNTRGNLRIASIGQNQHNKGKQSNNTSGYKGVCFHKTAGLWLAQIGYEGKNICLGLYNTPLEAYLAYCLAATLLHKEFARLV